MNLVATVDGKPMTTNRVDMQGILAATRDGQALTGNHIGFLRQGAEDKSIPTYQLSAWLTAACIRGLTGSEKGGLNEMIVGLGRRVDLSAAEAKIANRELTREEIDSFIARVVSSGPDRFADHQITPWLMAVRINGMTELETFMLTEAMTRYGSTLDLSGVAGFTVDKHSTGGVSDGTSLVIAPLVACFGLKVPMMSGRGLGHTGGTLDKLESIPGFSVGLTPEQVVAQLNQVGCAIFGQTETVAPADKRLYALRDVTQTVDSIPLIAASIMSKKLAEGSQGLVLNVTTGTAAFMEHFADAKKLAETMVAIAKNAGKRVSSVITTMDQPLAPAIGNALEIRQALTILAGAEHRSFHNFTRVVIELAAHMLVHGGLFRMDQLDRARQSLREKLASGEALEKFYTMVEAQGGRVNRRNGNPLGLPQAEETIAVLAPQDGFITSVLAKELGIAAMYLGAGKAVAEDRIDPAVGVRIAKSTGQSVIKGEPLAVLHVNRRDRLDKAKAAVLGAFEIGRKRKQPRNLIRATVV